MFKIMFRFDKKTEHFLILLHHYKKITKKIYHECFS